MSPLRDLVWLPFAAIDAMVLMEHRGGVMGASLRLLLNGLIAALFGLAIIPAPAQHARAMLERAAFVVAYAMPDGTLPAICADRGISDNEHGPHLLAPDCFACVIMGAPGLPVPAFVPAAHIAGAIAADQSGEHAIALRQVAGHPQHARGPPLPFIA